MMNEAEAQAHIVHECLKIAQSRQKNYYDKHHEDVNYEVGEKAYLRVTPLKGVRRFSIRRKLAPHYVGPFTILSKHGELADKLELPPNFPDVHDIFHVSQLKRCFKDPARGVDHEAIDLQEDLTYREYPLCVLDEAERKTRRQTIKFLKIQWSHHSEQEATWEREDRLRSEYPSFFSSV